MGPEHTEHSLWFYPLDGDSAPIQLIFKNGSQIITLPYDDRCISASQMEDEPDIGPVDLTEVL